MMFQHTNIAVAMAAAAAVNAAARKVTSMIGMVARRLEVEKGTIKIIKNVRHAPVKKSANIQCDATRITGRRSVTSEGRTTIQSQ